jgi:hypothetical protein
MAYASKSAILSLLGRDDFELMREVEHAAIQNRRDVKDPTRIVHAIPREEAISTKFEVFDTTGLALSGGGVRAAAFSLGVLQALNESPGFDRIDYLSTVSGGGYMGASLTATMAQSGGEFVFTCNHDFSDTEAMGHLRNYSNYLLPRGETGSFTRGFAVLLRGWTANVALILAAVLFCAIVIFLAYPQKETLLAGSLPLRLLRIDLLPWPFALTAVMAIVSALFYLGWAVWRSFTPARGQDVQGPAVIFGGWLNVALLLVAFVDLQPVAIAGLFWLHETRSNIYDWIKDAVVALSPLGGVVAFFGSRIGAFLKTSRHSQGTMVMLSRLAAKAAVWFAAIILPLLIWLLMLYICAGAIADPTAPRLYPLSPFAPDGAVRVFGFMLSIHCLYALAFLILLAVTLTFGPNANSLHRLYRDRLSKAFLFDPTKPDGDGNFPDLDSFKLSHISPAAGGPYHLINAAVNLQGSKAANRRGRNADFFHFSSDFVGSDCTGYVTTAKMEKADNDLDLATAVAVSGAAVSSDMGANSVKPLAPTLALLNIRLGYWMCNPKFAGKLSWLRRKFNDVTKYYLLQEMLGWLDEDQDRIYLTDGGHVENLGLYQLLKRGCRAIVVVDAESDPEMVFPSYITLQRYARIDLGVRIDLPWMDIAAASLAVTDAAEKEAPLPNKSGPHCALGHIHYPNGVTGYLLYIKSSVTGDENDQVIDYKKRNTSFPHETTGDQFFTEEQFEVYRALGFHAANGFFSGTQDFAWVQGGGIQTQAGALAAFKALF